MSQATLALPARAVRPARNVALYVAALVAVLAILAVPICSVQIPPITDYPNHLARAYVLAFGAHDPFLSSVYAARWRVIPDIALDVLLPPLGRVLPFYVAGRVILGVSVLLPVVGTVLYACTLRGRPAWGALGAGLVAYNLTALYGFMNFLFAIGLALIGAALWERWRERRPWLAVGVLVPLAVAVFFTHLFGLGLLMVLLGCAELAPAWARWRAGQLRLRWCLVRLAALLAVLAAPALLMLAAPFAAEPLAPRWAPLYTLVFAISPFAAYNPILDGATALLVAETLGFLAWKRWLSVAPSAGLAAAMLIVLFPFVPMDLKGATFVSLRFPIMAAFVVFAAIEPRMPRRWMPALAMATAALFLGRTGWLTYVWQGQNQDLREIRATIAPVPPGSSVLVMWEPIESRPAPLVHLPPYERAMPPHRVIGYRMFSYTHLPALLVLERDSIWPLMFTTASKQPVTVRPAWRDRTLPEGVPLSFDVLDGRAFTADDLHKAPYLADWWKKFDYVLVLEAGADPNLTRVAPDRLELVTRTDLAALLRVRKPD